MICDYKGIRKSVLTQYPLFSIDITHCWYLSLWNLPMESKPYSGIGFILFAHAATTFDDCFLSLYTSIGLEDIIGI